MMNFMMQNFFLLSIFLFIGSVPGNDAVAGCTFNGISYAIGSYAEFGCFNFFCSKSATWEYSYINGNCPTCWVWNDPHFYTFDNHYQYDFHGTCNYTISQPIGECDEGLSYYPPYGIFGDFLSCVGVNNPSCVDATTYKISDDLFVVIKHSNPVELEINGVIISLSSNPVTYTYSFSSVIVWLDSDHYCVNVVGQFYSINACPNGMVIYTIPDHYKSISGLCGYYSGDQTDEFMLRDCSPGDMNDPLNFGKHWTAIDQQDKECSFIKIEILPCEEEDQIYEMCNSYAREATQNCPNGYNDEDVKHVIENCVKDCCGTGFENCERWAYVGYEFLCTINKLSNQTRGGKEARRKK